MSKKIVATTDAPAAVGPYSQATRAKGFVFVSHTGNIYPSGFLPVPAGNVKSEELLDVYRDHPQFRALRDPSRLKGKCAACEFKTICGGSFCSDLG